MHNKFYKRLLSMMNGFLYQQKTRICSLLLVSTQLLAQIDNKSLENENSFNDTKLKKVQFHFAALSYVKNNEYFNEIADGYTLFGEAGTKQWDSGNTQKGCTHRLFR